MSLESLMVTEEQGPVYGGRQLLVTESGQFYFTYEGKSKDVGQLVVTNIYQYRLINITEFGLTQKDFQGCTLNEFGFKEVGIFGDYSLQLTRNGSLVMYHKGVPSVVGLPSKYEVISGAWVSKEGCIMVPHISAFDSNQFTSLSVMALAMSFRKVDKSIRYLLSKAKTGKHPYQQKNNTKLLSDLYEDTFTSDYHNRYMPINIDVHSYHEKAKQEGIPSFVELI